MRLICLSILLFTPGCLSRTRFGADAIAADMAHERARPRQIALTDRERVFRKNLQEELMFEGVDVVLKTSFPSEFIPEEEATALIMIESPPAVLRQSDLEAAAVSAANASGISLHRIAAVYEHDHRVALKGYAVIHRTEPTR